MAKKQYKAETKRLLDLVIHSIYTHKEIFLRELVSNASDALDKLYFTSLSEDIDIDRTKLSIKIELDEANRTLTIMDNGIGMTQTEVENNLGVIAKSGSFAFKEAMEAKNDDVDIIGQFGVGFYSAFMVADKVEVFTQSISDSDSIHFESTGEDGYRIDVCEKQERGTRIVLHLKKNADEEDYDQYLHTYTLKRLVKKYSDYVRYPILMNEEEKEYDDKGEVTSTKIVETTLNSMIPLWKRSKSDLKDEDYNSFYQDKFNDYQDPQKYIHTSLEGTLSFDALLFIPSHIPYNFYSSEYQTGLQLYSRGVYILDNAKELLPEAFRFVKGLVDSPDLTLNISREMLQHDRQLHAIANRIEKKIKSELLLMLKNDRENYEKFYKNFGLQLKYGTYANFGAKKEVLEDLLLFTTSRDKKLVSLEEYVARMSEEQKEIYYISGESVEKCDLLPQTDFVKDKGYEILYLTDDVDEFVLQVLMQYKEKPFKSITQGQLDDLESVEEKEALKEKSEANKDILAKLKEILKDEVSDVRLTNRLKNHPVCLVADEGVSLEMEKILAQMPDQANAMKAKRILELNAEHPLIQALESASEDRIKDYAKLLYNQALLIEGFNIENPVEFSRVLSQLMIDASK